jgi:hypothetical protein
MSLVTGRGKSWRGADVCVGCTCAYLFTLCAIPRQSLGAVQMVRWESAPALRPSVRCMCAISCIHLRPVAESWLIPCADKSCGCNFPSSRPGGMKYIHSSFCSHLKFYAATYCCLNVLQCTRLFFLYQLYLKCTSYCFFLPFQMIICDCTIVTWNPWSG